MDREEANVNGGSQICGKCEKRLPLDYFAKSQSRANGFKKHCRLCESLASRRPGGYLEKRQCLRMPTVAPEGSVFVPLTQGKFALIDVDDAERVMQYNWCACKSSGHKNQDVYYAMRSVLERGRWRTLLLHRFIMNAPDGVLLDHENFNPLDCRKRNLRFATHSQNNVHKQHIVNRTGFRGVHRTREGRFKARITCNGKLYFGKHVSDPVEAARQYDALAERLFGSFAVLNFPDSRVGQI